VTIDYTLQVVLAGVTAIGLAAGLLGAFAFLRRQSLLGDAVAHCTLPGLAGAFLLSGSRDPLLLLAGAAATGWLGAIVVAALVRRTRLHQDAALALVLAVFFGFGLVLMTQIQKHPSAAQAGLDAFLFGQAATMLDRDVRTILILGGAAVGLVLIMARAWKLVSFDADFARTLGWPVRALEIALVSTLITAVVIGLQSVGVVLMSALLVAPAAAARQWTHRLTVMLLLSGLIGAAAAAVGTLVGAAANLPTGPTIVLAASVVVVVSLALGSSRGLVWGAVMRHRRWRHIRLERLLRAIDELGARHDDPQRAVPEGLLRTNDLGARELRWMLRQAARRGWLAPGPGASWRLTPAGRSVLAVPPVGGRIP
jgi:manganese/zinc/iron transport system permease protein